MDREKLSGSQRQRGMYMNVGAIDVGPDQKWEEKNRKQKQKEIELGLAAVPKDSSK